MQKPRHPKIKLPFSVLKLLTLSAVPLTLLGAPATVWAQSSAAPAPAKNIDAIQAGIRSIEIRGVTRLSADEIRSATTGLVGKEHNPNNTRKAVEAVEALYRARQIDGVSVFLASEDQAKGSITIDVVEAGQAARTEPAVAPAPAPAADRFAINEFAVSGARTISAAEIAGATAKHVGKDKNFGDIQKAIEAVEDLYRARGYGAVQILLPEQDISQGTVAISVIETPIGKITVNGNQQYSADNIRRSLPGLTEGASPNAKQISQNVQLANENQGKQIEVVLAVGEQDNTVDARVEVKEDQLQRFFATADNTGTKPTGNYRLGVGYTHNNLFDRDHSASIAYTTAPDAPESVDINILSLSYRAPIYGFGDSLSLLYGYSDVSTPTAQSTGFAINGKGHLAALRWNHHLARIGEYSHQIVTGIDYKNLQSTCTDVSGNVLTGTAGCIDYVTTPLSLAYLGRGNGLSSQYDYSLSLAYNIASGSRYAFTSATTSGTDHYSLAAGNRETRDNFSILRLAGSYTHAFGDWLTRANFISQYVPSSAMVSSEQFGLAGSQAVRGFLDRIVVADSGAVLNLEVYTPELAPLIGLPAHNLRLLAFFDYGYGRDNKTAATATKKLGSAGLGLRYQYRKDVSFKLDAASILVAEPDGVYRGSDPAGGVLDSNNKGDWRAHGAIMISF